MSLVDGRIKTQVSQVDRGLINKKFNVITVRQFGHYAYECRKKQYDQGRKIPNRSSNTSTMSSVMSMEYASPIECNVVQEIPHDIWYLDSSSNNHMTGNLNLFSNLDNSVQTNVTLGNNVDVTILGKYIVGILTK